MKLISINVGLPREINWQGKVVRTFRKRLWDADV